MIMKRSESYLLHILRSYVTGFAGVQKMISSLGFNNAECINRLDKSGKFTLLTQTLPEY
ncbi:hypothetical protein MKY54_19740 [Paenibacillus sp. FSL P2-0121]|uniref:hypothetical protein n=2 Tax=Paenibacillus TaxID=44249 RepID=UPI0030D065CE